MTKFGCETPSQQQPKTLLDDSDTDLLFCQRERLEQTSPELWPEQIPGVTEFTSSYLFTSPIKPIFDITAESIHDQELSQDDYELLQEFGSLTSSQIMEKFQSLKQQAYALGREEAREMTRGKFLNILGKQKGQNKK